MAICPHCKQALSVNDVKREVKGVGFFKQEIMYICPNCDTVIGFSRGNYG